MTKEKLLICFEGNVGSDKSSIIELYKDDRRFSIRAEPLVVDDDNDYIIKDSDDGVIKNN